ncbi:hypothetical protein [Terasakiispira papahanaumokuakeensis]|uniref:hypothetical protein n=1 Tax=Terasakiispira papahanaumokuakeensis TaxID=197479 RepID=UPI00111248CA|nr:hypothetical protein [Terasakiispira papahanaumokuakeensis]
MLTTFAVAFIFGSVVGTMARTQHWFAPEPSAPPAFPWATHELDPPTIKSALQWIGLQKALLERGYTTNEINDLYDIQSAEWQRLADQRKDQAIQQDFLPPIDIDLTKILGAGNEHDGNDGFSPYSQEVPYFIREQNQQPKGP